MKTTSTLNKYVMKNKIKNFNQSKSYLKTF